jgi:hypothetical protein
METDMDAETTGAPHSEATEMTWLTLARHIAAMTPEQRRRPVYVLDPDTGRTYTPGLVLAGDDLPDECVQHLHRDASIIPGGSSYLTPYATGPDAPAHPADSLVLVALDLDAGEEPPADEALGGALTVRHLRAFCDPGGGRRSHAEHRTDGLLNAHSARSSLLGVRGWTGVLLL